MPTKDDSVDPYMNPANNDGSTLGLECSEDPSLLNKVAECIVENSEGKFLMAKLYTKSLEDKLTNSEIESALDDLSCHRLSLADLINTSYTNDIRKRIQGQGTARAKQAFEILSIVYFARRKLRFREFLHALATKAKDRKFYNQKNEMREKDILKLTNGFITIGRDRDKIIRLTDDRTLREYFDDTCEDWFPEGERDMAERCVRYLSFETFAKPCEVDELQAKEKEHPFLSYAVQHWGTHVRLAAVQVEDFVIDFLQNTSRNQAYIQCAWELDTDEIEKWDVRRTIFPLHICAWFNLCYSIQELGDDIDYDIREGTYGQTALMYACRRGHKEMVKLLLDRGALLNITSDRGRTALFEAILRNNHVQINTTTVVDLLLNHPRHLEIDLNITNHQCFDRTVLMVAIDQNTRTSAAIAISLLKLPNLDRNKQDSRGNTALTLAAARGNLDVVNALMIFEDLKLDLRDSVAGRTALMYAAAGGHPNIVDALLQRGADLDLQDFSGATAALRAAEKANQEVLERLIKFGVNLTLVDKEGRTLMHGASQNGSVGVMELLVNFKEYTPKLDQRDKYGMTPLHVACGFGQLEAAKFLIAKGLDWKEVDSFNRTPFDIACHYGHETLIDLLEKQATAPGTTRMQRPKLEDLPLWSLAVQQNLDAVKTALSTGATDLSIREPGAERTVIHCAVRYCNGTAGPQILEAILNADDEYINEPDGFKDTPLHLAVRQNCLACTELLLEHDPTVDEPDRFGLTPLDQACRDENYDIAMLLLNAGAPIGNSNVGLSKMIFQAAELKNDNAVKRLLVAGADRMVPDEYGRTIDMLIKRTGNMKLLKIVQSFPSFRYPATKEKQGIVTVKEIEPPQIGSQGRLRRVSPV
jgi:ankyrin repeat protein